MSNVTLSIGGRSFAVACAEGEEDHIAGLGEIISAKLVNFGDAAKLGETRMLLYAALFLADELQEARGAMRTPTNGASGDGGQLVAIADLLENLAARLEREHASA